MQFRFLLLPALAIAAWGQTTPQLEVASADLDPATHLIRVTLVNHSSKTAAAYAIDFRQFDSAGKPVGESGHIGYDWAGMLVWGDRADPHFILPGGEGEAQFGAAPDAISASAQVVAVVYKDRTAEGDRKSIAHFFDARQRHAEQAQAAADLLATYPASTAEAEDRLGKIAGLNARTGSVEQLLKNRTLDREQWSAAAKEQKRFADGLSALSKEATQ